ncbi:hypothetical protein ONS95_004054 [Cadophora gregata]|uniref:uncharacterized protein n=1 Tax=Cadophora gregata TaxID=51156 RepID=UPI0026DCF542|nr:uncharacterized protein ONS95_004054 [Cadophora gregata]KAK0107361.1 hypothetical protein ONS95_004054 [Cadophora gregata]KAK0117039.1 hypothetical protein ONS96_012881 [Cadophora gregata f. sp. sojae]
MDVRTVLIGRILDWKRARDPKETHPFTGMERTLMPSPPTLMIGQSRAPLCSPGLSSLLSREDQALSAINTKEIIDTGF